MFAANHIVMGCPIWTEAAFCIARPEGPLSVIGEVWQCFGLHRAGPDRWPILTHLPTGCAVGMAETDEVAKSAAAAILPVRDWNGDVLDFPAPGTTEHDDLTATLRAAGLCAPGGKLARDFVSQ
jgi:hypothetical protein